ncbi:uncharacterized protein LOC128956257 [Oppia nitens]|uniref:uncharacterized protein LOC128956257 n=1 Tax=Oppia nitens TaxID=1686743 RepID=UPI0023DB4674|nr:uncharacterized protein LOC128956257 [Oppia nitens]
MHTITSKIYDVMADGIKSDTKLTVSMFNCYLKKWSTEISAILSPEAREYHNKRFDSTTGMVINYLNDGGIKTADKCDWPKPGRQKNKIPDYSTMYFVAKVYANIYN